MTTSVSIAIQTQAFRDKLAQSVIGNAPHYKLTTAVLGFGWLKTVNGKKYPDLTQVPATALSVVPNQFKEISDPIFNYVNGKITVQIEASDFATNESHEYNIVGIKDNTGEIAMILIGQPAYVSSERPLIINATFENRLVIAAQ